MPDLSSNKLITNRQLNFTLAPVDLHNPKQMPYKMQSFEIDGTWNQHQSIILDALLERSLRGYYRDYNNLPKSWISQKVVKTIAATSGDHINPVPIRYLNSSALDAFSLNEGYDVTGKMKDEYSRCKEAAGDNFRFEGFEQFRDHQLDKDYRFHRFNAQMSEISRAFHADLIIPLDLANFFEAYPFMSNYRYSLAKELQKISETKFKMAYKVKYMAEKPDFNDKGKLVYGGQLDDLKYEMRGFQHILAAHIDHQNLVLNFDTPLGKLILHNMQILDTDWCPVEAMKLSKNAYFIFKRFILNASAGKRRSETIDIKFDALRSFLDFNGANIGGVYATLGKALDELVAHQLIIDYRIEKRFKQRMYRLQLKSKKIRAKQNTGKKSGSSRQN